MFWCPVSLKRVSSLALQHFPDGPAVGFDDHAAFDDFGGLRHVARKNDVLKPGCKIRLRAVMGDSAITCGVFI